MAKATGPKGRLNVIDNCFIFVQGAGRIGAGPEKGKLDDSGKTIKMNIVPDISDSKSASYQAENGIGRAAPFTVFAHSELRTINWTCHFVLHANEAANAVSSASDLIDAIRTFQSALYPTTSDGKPPPICKLRCGSLLGEEDVCAVLKSYNVKYDTTVPWDPITLIPYKVDIDLTFDVIYDQSNLPIQSKILQFGY